MTECAEVVITGPTPEWAEDLAQLLVEERLAACVHIVPETRAVYRWEDEINDDPESRLQVHTRADLVDEMREQPAEPARLDVRVVGDRLAREVHAQVERQRGPFAGAFGHADDEPLEQARGAVDQVDMAVGDRVEGTGIDGDAAAVRAHGG